MEGIRKSDNRIIFIVPEHSDAFDETFSLSSLVYYSGKTLKNVLRFCENKIAYIVPGQVSEIDYKLAVRLNLPI